MLELVSPLSLLTRKDESYETMQRRFVAVASTVKESATFFFLFFRACSKKKLALQRSHTKK